LDRISSAAKAGVGPGRDKITSVLKSLGIVLGIMTAATGISFAFRALGFNESNFIMTYILGVLLAAYLTIGYVYSVIASVLGVLVFNFFFTEPYYSFVAYNPQYPVTFIIMLIVALLTSTLTSRVRRESVQADLREKRIRILYLIERHLLAAQNLHQVLDAASQDAFSIFGNAVIVTGSGENTKMSTRTAQTGNVFGGLREQAALKEAMESGLACGAGTELFEDSRAFFQPIIGQRGVLGVVGVEMDPGAEFSENQRVLLETVATQIGFAIERELLFEEQQIAKVDIEKERLRNNLLRSVSHDLRTPLTGIIGSASTILEGYDSLDDDKKKLLLQNITEDADWLKNLVENILSMTRFGEKSVTIKRESEAVEELIAGAIDRVKSRVHGREIAVSIPEDVLVIRVDGLLIEQVLVNLLDNAIKFTPDHTRILVSVTADDKSVKFEIRDWGPGFSETDLLHMFDSIYLTDKAPASGARGGFGLGLSICKAIVEAHGGRIAAKNVEGEGASIAFEIPAKEISK
jgi:two-component system sensor histidine kinase KdpD